MSITLMYIPSLLGEKTYIDKISVVIILLLHDCKNGIEATPSVSFPLLTEITLSIEIACYYTTL